MKCSECLIDCDTYLTLELHWQIVHWDDEKTWMFHGRRVTGAEFDRLMAASDLVFCRHCGAEYPRAAMPRLSTGALSFFCEPCWDAFLERTRLT